MRTKKATLNAGVAIITYILAFIPVFITRKVFLDSLGVELLGLSSLYTNIIGYLSIVEMGIGTAIIFSLYKPFAENDMVRVKGYLNFYKNFYKTTGVIVLILGFLILPFIQIFIKDNINITEVRLYFILFLINTVITYFFSYKLCILNVAQEGYKLSIATTLSKIIIAILQIIFLKLYANFYIYIFIQIAINLLYYLFMDIYINKKFEFINKVKGEINRKEKTKLIKNIKALFLHKIGGVVVLGTDSIVISSFVNLDAVAKFNSYNMVIAAVQGLMTNAMSAITPSIGNLLTEDNRETAYKVHKRLFFISFWITSFIVISLSNTLTVFVNLWLGESQILAQFTVALILINLYFQMMRSSVESFKEGGGIYHQDRYAPIAEAIINLITSIILVKLIGLPGVFLGTLISNITVIFWVKPK
ncbi:lipopolysaccharide biosynthesis protein, partial [Clostridium tarantellae]